MHFEKFLQNDLPEFVEGPELTKACHYSLSGGGKRLRPLIVYLVSEALGKQFPVDDVALSVEYFHTASLIADDLPCMDNDEFRRDHKTLHKKFCESTALLASYALITRAFEKIADNARAFEIESKRCQIALKEASIASGLLGATGGQYLDIHFENPKLENLLAIIEKKTVTLFSVSFLLGWIFGGGDLSKLDTLKSAAFDFGIAFQILDDIDDQKQDNQKQSAVNLALFLGEIQAKERLERHLGLFEKKMRDLGLYNASFEKLIEKIKKR